jgi:hypothetical protein
MAESKLKQRCFFCGQKLGVTYIVHNEDPFCKPDCLDNYVMSELSSDWDEYDKEAHWRDKVLDPTQGTLQ